MGKCNIIHLGIQSERSINIHHSTKIGKKLKELLSLKSKGALKGAVVKYQTALTDLILSRAISPSVNNSYYL